MKLDGICNIQELRDKKQIVKQLRDLGYLENGTQFTAEQIAIASEKINKLLGLELDNEQFQFFMSDKKRMLCEATAGSGKTTLSQYKIIKRKIFYGLEGRRCLCLAFNDHSAIDMEKRHRDLVDKLLKANIKGITIDPTIVSRSFHSNAMNWVKDFYKECNLKYDKDFIAPDHVLLSGMRKSLEAVIKKKELEFTVSDASVKNIMSFNKYIRETLLTKDKWFSTGDYETMVQFDPNLRKLKPEDFETAFNKFKMIKKITSNFDFTDMLEMFLNLLKNNEKARNQIQNYYKYVVADECQDMTPLLTECLKNMIGEDTYLVMIGDGDQSIYSFMGAQPDNCLRFKEHFEDGVVLSMSLNRRCPKNIVHVVSSLINTNVKRYKKPIYTTNDYGNLNIRMYNNAPSEFHDIIQLLKDKSLQELSRVCICYRNRESSYLLSRALSDNAIPFRVGSGFQPYKDLLSKKLSAIMHFLSNTKNKIWQEEVLPVLLPGIDKANLSKQIRKHSEVKDWTDYDYNVDVKNFAESAVILDNAIQAHKAKKPLKEYFPLVFSLFRRYYWDFVSHNINFDTRLEKDILKEYFQDISYADFAVNVAKKKDMIERAKNTHTGVLLTTFHTTKGLEFDDVIIVDLDDDIFPNFSKIDSSNYSPDTKLDLKEECVRLLYVAMTRTKQNLIMYWRKDNPGPLLDLIRKSNYDINKIKKAEEIGEIATDDIMDFNDSDLGLDEIDMDNTENTKTTITETKSEPSGENVAVTSTDNNTSPKSNTEITMPCDKECKSDSVNEHINNEGNPETLTHKDDINTETVDLEEDTNTEIIDLEEDTSITPVLTDDGEELEIEKTESTLVKDTEVKDSINNLNMGVNRVDKILALLKERG